MYCIVHNCEQFSHLLEISTLRNKKIEIENWPSEIFFHMKIKLVFEGTGTKLFTAQDFSWTFD